MLRRSQTIKRVLIPCVRVTLRIETVVIKTTYSVAGHEPGEEDDTNTSLAPGCLAAYHKVHVTVRRRPQTCSLENISPP